MLTSPAEEYRHAPQMTIDLHLYNQALAINGFWTMLVFYQHLQIWKIVFQAMHTDPRMKASSGWYQHKEEPNDLIRKMVEITAITENNNKALYLLLLVTVNDLNNVWYFWFGVFYFNIRYNWIQFTFSIYAHNLNLSYKKKNIFKNFKIKELTLGTSLGWSSLNRVKTCFGPDLKRF